MDYLIDVSMKKEEYSEQELELINGIFGLFTKNIYFSMYCNISVIDEKFINFSGISGSGKTIIKDEMKRITQENNIKTLDFDDLDFSPFMEMTIIELLHIKSSTDEILKLLGGFGLYEMRILTLPIKNLSQGQRTRLKYVYLLSQISDELTYIFIDEFLTFVDDLSSISFARSVQKFLKDKNIKLFTYGVNMNLIGQFEDISYVLGNSSITAVIKDNVITNIDDIKSEKIEIKKNSYADESLDDW